MITRTLTAVAAIGLFEGPGLSRCSGWPEDHCSTPRRGQAPTSASSHSPLARSNSWAKGPIQHGKWRFPGYCFAHPAWIPNLRGYRGCAARSLRPNNLNELCYCRQVTSDSWLTLRKSGLVCDISSISGDNHCES
ncbi:hypothetical protein BJY00DRAFT_275263 [Aspergillus carlsbadensis]|nr:hypothetical protein BJY00DRAFT_275263 [Aspergillus carlsbadensis]